MNAPKTIVAYIEKKHFRNIQVEGAYRAWEENHCPFMPDNATKYTRSDIVEALVKACNDVLKPLNQMDSLFQGILVADETNNAVTVRVTDLRALSTALKALGE